METTYYSLHRDLEKLISGIDQVEKFIGTDFAFHDASLRDLHVSNDGEVVLEIITWSAVQSDKYFLTRWVLHECVIINCCEWNPRHDIYQIRIEPDEHFEKRLTLFLDGLGPSFTCQTIDITVEEID